jgi:hypothetical protein
MIHVFKENSPSLEEAQNLVGGFVQMVKSPINKSWQILVNEEGLLLGLPMNDEATALAGTGHRWRCCSVKKEKHDGLKQLLSRRF